MHRPVAHWSKSQQWIIYAAHERFMHDGYEQTTVRTIATAR